MQLRCPDPDWLCGAARTLEESIRASRPDLLLATFRFEPVVCPPVSQGAGGPYPLCDGAPVGETRNGFVFMNDAQGFTFDSAAASTYAGKVTDAQTKDGNWRVRSLACDADGCSRALVVLGFQLDAGGLAERNVLIFTVRKESSSFSVESMTNAAFVGEGTVLLNGGALANPSHIVLFDFSAFSRWSVA